MHSSDIRNTSIFRRCSKRSIFKYLKNNIIKIQRFENWPLYQVFSIIFLKAQKNVKYAYVWIELRVCHYYVFMPRRKTKKGLRFNLGEVGGAHASKVRPPLNDPTTLPWVSPMPKSFVALNSRTFQRESGTCCTPWWCHTSVCDGSGFHNPCNATKTFTFTSALRAQQF